ncbi:argininosuccinate synthase [Aphanizomenon flos-aquae NRERC-008]|jgi:argininosuccinate synthase|uniref:Argininosuccinate synthase n=2 Tax=Aphanizomenon flos-aquae TaxID=1176 RepID=A0ABR8ILZ7_APHFL|nr:MULTISPECIES: argininosuccinate synthase [Aphanizomenon]MBO1042702.1 argininosuccinate synthase [Aphanizomenon flos-aquae UKL13-PB]MBO1062755.1 argininosuccinate synthase [Aphanizomenon flos-aquae CP01]NTW21652.1 argininosuccinate synthase [Nostocales cyanobacterium W4_Combined_metabat2_030]OBQ19572.1 MAG: argininosuccinate synthase [Aphanizomenon flos-aquae LD13]OBQ29721.1 MAG: argininosuccinate synthase [Aphanizomenon flos-aquae MDT14a]QSV68041.1 MAG: argininosuccinate synthase [Aphanizo
MGRAKKVVLAYSGGVDTSVCIPYLKQEWGVEEIITLAADLGQGDELEPVREKALKSGASESLVADVKDIFVKEYAFPAIQANALYENRYPLGTALARPLIAKILVEAAAKYDADAIAHGCTGKGNDQVRFDVSCAALNPNLKILAPAREWGMSREQTIAYGEKFGIPAPVKKSSPFSIDKNLLGRSIEAGTLEDPANEPPEEIYEMTKAIADTPNEPEYLEIGFQKGLPTTINGTAKNPVELIEQLNKIVGNHGIGRIDMIENRLVGIKSREIYESPAMVVLINAHRDLESLTLTADVTQYKRGIEETYTKLVYNGLWYSPLKAALDAFIQQTQERVSGVVRLKLFKGNAVIVGRWSDNTLYTPDLATYGAEDQFDHKAAEGFIYVWGLPTRIWAQGNK